MNGYVCFWRNNRFEIYADTTYEAQKICAMENKIKKPYEISVVLAEKDGKQITHIPTF